MFDATRSIEKLHMLIIFVDVRRKLIKPYSMREPKGKIFYFGV